jgi:hypothetical protein
MTDYVRSLVSFIGYEVDESGAERAANIFTGLKNAAETLNGWIEHGKAKIREWTIGAAEAGDHAAKMGKRLGITAEEVQQLSYVAARAGTSIEAIANGLKFAQKNAYAANGGNKEAIESFRDLGVEYKDQATGAVRPAVDILRDASDAMGAIQDPAKRTALVMKIFGKSGTELLPAMLDGEKGITSLMQRMTDLGDVMSDDDAAAAEDLVDSLHDAEFAAEGVAKRFAVMLFPVLKKMIDGTIKFYTSNRKLIDSGLRVVADIITELYGLYSKLKKTVMENTRVLLIFALLMTTMLIPSIIAQIGALGMLIKVLWITRGHWLSVLYAQLAAIAPIAGMIAGFALIALILEDIFGWANGDDSLIGNLFAAFLDAPSSPNDHWMVVTLRAIMSWTRGALQAIDQFWKGFFDDAEKSGGIWEATKNALVTAIVFWKDQIVDFFNWILGKFASIPAPVRLALNAIPGVGSVAAGLEAANVARTLASTASPATAPVGGQAGRQLLASGAGGGVSFGDTTLHVEVKAGNGGSPNETAAAVGEAAARALENHRRALLHEVESRVKR